MANEKKKYVVRELNLDGSPYRGKVFHDDRQRNELGDLVLDAKGEPIGKCTYKSGEVVELTDEEAKSYARHVVPVTP